MVSSKEKLLDEIKWLADKLNGTPSKEEMRSEGEYSASTYQEHFGSWNTAIEAAGLEPNLQQNSQISCEGLIAELKRLADELGRTPKSLEMAQEGAYSAYTYKDRFGSWNEAIKAAGLDPNSKGGPGIPREDLIEELQQLADELGKTPSTAEMNEHGEYTAESYRRRFGSWNEAVENAGLDSNDRFEKIPRRELIAELQRLAEERGESPTTSDMNTDGKFSAGTYINRFGSWTAAIKAANIE